MGPTDSPLITYFSFIVLGLMMCIGYVVLRLLGKKKEKEERERRRLEDILKDAEIEARRSASIKPDGEGDVLALPVGMERKMQQIKELAQQKPTVEKFDHPESQDPNKREMGN